MEENLAQLMLIYFVSNCKRHEYSRFPKGLQCSGNFFFSFFNIKANYFSVRMKKEGEKDLITCSYSELVYIA